MSAIDGYNHVHLGYIFNLPVYWIIEENIRNDITDSPDNIGKYNLIIGGGSGEHPALIIDIDKLLFDVIYQNTEKFCKNFQIETLYNFKKNYLKHFTYIKKEGSELYGKFIKNNEVIWGYSLDDWKLDHINQN